MSGAEALLILVSLTGLVGGQLLLKVAMRETNRNPVRKGRVAAFFAGGILAMTVWFMLWLGLMQTMDLSHLFPFEGLASILLSVAACVILKERASLRMWAAIGLIAAGVVLVGFSSVEEEKERTQGTAVRR